MAIWKNTNTLDGLIDDLPIAESKPKAKIALLGSKTINLDEFPNLKGIFRVGIGIENVPLKEAMERGIKIGIPSEKTAEYIYEETAGFTCHLIFTMLYRHVGNLDSWVKFPRVSLQNKELLVIGTGHIGTRVANKMQSFLKVNSYDVLSNLPSSLTPKIKTADCISIHIPYNKDNDSFFDREKLALMKDQSILINTARGKIVSEDALYQELKNERLYAAFDVFWQEPYRGKLKEFYPQRFFMSPHVASTCDLYLEGTANDFRKFVMEIV